MTRLEACVTSGTPRNAHLQSSGKHIMVTVVVTFLLAVSFALTGASAAAAAPGCGNPGVCPDFPNSATRQTIDSASASQALLVTTEPVLSRSAACTDCLPQQGA